MARRPPTASRTVPPAPAFPPQLAAANVPAAGIDVGADAHVVAVPPRDAPQPVRGCGACPAALEALAAWLVACARTPVALASTGGYWLPLFALLEARGCEGLLVDPQHVQQSQGRPPRDVQDCPWRQRLPPLGLLASACRPTDQGWGRRSDRRQRALLRTSAAQPSPHRQQALTQMHSKLPHVVSESTGVTGLAILRAILAGERDPGPLAQRRNAPCKHDEGTIARALQGHWRAEPLGALAPAMAL